MDRLNKALGLALVLSIVAAAACSAPSIPADEPLVGSRAARASNDAAPPPQAPGADEDLDGDGGMLPSASNEAGSAAPAAPGAPAPASCAGSATYDSCFACCDAPAAGALAASDQAIDACSCGAGGACASLCGANYCNGQKPNDACSTCVTTTCAAAGAAQCTMPACQAAKQCLKNDCAGKP